MSLRYCFRTLLCVVVVRLLPLTAQPSVVWVKSAGPGAGRVTSLTRNASGVIFAGTSAGVYRSADGGQAWTAVNNGLSELSVTAVAAGNGSVVIAGTAAGGIFVTTDGGADWTFTKRLPARVNDLKFTPSGVVYVATEWGGFYRSFNNGADWMRDANFVTAMDNARCIFVTPAGNVCVGAGNLVFYYHPDAGWRGQQSADRCITVDPLGSLIAGGQGAVSRARTMTFGPTEWNTFEHFSRGLPYLILASVVHNSNGRLFAGTMGGGVYESVTHGETWAPSNGGTMADTVTSLLAVNDTIIAGASDGFVYRTAQPTLVLLPPMQNGPGNGGVLPAYSASFTWAAAPGAAAYRVQCSVDTLFQGDLLFDQTTAALTATVNGLPTVSRIYWRVRSENGAQQSPYSAVWSVITGPVPPAPVLVSPADSATAVPVSNVTLAWRKDPTAYEYRGGINGYASVTVTDTFMVVPSLPYSATLSWSVYTRNIAGIGPSATAVFTTIDQPPGAPTVRTPAASAFNVPIAASLTWYPVPKATAYHVQLSANASFTAPLLVDDSAMTTEVRAVSLQFSTMYHWRVRAATNGGWGPFCAGASFTTVPPPPAPPVTLDPPDGTVGEPPYTRLAWSASARAATYQLQVVRDTSGWDALPPQWSTSSNAVSAAFEPQTVYYWRVAAVNAGGRSAWSATARFRTTKEDSILRWGTGTPTEAMLFQNFPNPLTVTGTWLQFAVPEASPVLLTAYTIQGVEAARLFDETIAPGVFRLLWVPKNIPSGTYLLVMRSGGYRAVKKMLFLK